MAKSSYCYGVYQGKKLVSRHKTKQDAQLAQKAYGKKENIVKKRC